MVEENRSRLGRGLAALIGDVGDDLVFDDRQAGQKLVPIEFIRPNPLNPRREFNEDDLSQLSSSIQEKGILQPILVRALLGMSGVYEIIAGERRWRAAQRAGLHDVPVVIVEATDKESLEIAIIENVQRADLNALEEAQGYDSLAEQFGYSQTDLAKVIGKSRSHVANTLRLLRLPEKAKDYLRSGKLTAGHARALLTSDHADDIAERIIKEDLSVREVERLVQAGGSEREIPSSSASREKKSPDIVALEQSLADALGLVVTLASKREGGELRINYKTIDQLDSVCRKLKA